MTELLKALTVLARIQIVDQIVRYAIVLGFIAWVLWTVYEK